MSFRAPNNSLMAAMASMMGSMPQPYHQIQGMQPMGLLPMQMMPPMPPGTIAPMGVTVPSGVTTISAPPVRNITLSSSQNPNQMGGQTAPPSLLGVYPGANPVRPPFTIFQQMAAATQDTSQQMRKPRPAPGSTITVFVGNITDRASDMLIRQLLSKCGTVNNWKRVQGANGKLQAFGFCEYCDQESAMRAVRLLKDFEIADKKLVVKVDPKTQEKLDEYLKSKGFVGKELDEQTKEEDAIIFSQLQTVLKEHEIELSKEPDIRERQRRTTNANKDPTKPENLSEMDLEDDKRSLIHREIDKFRDTYKKMEEEKEKEKEKKRKDDDKPLKEEDIKPNRRNSRDRSRDRSVDRDRSSRRESSRRDRDRERDRERERERERDRDRYRERDRRSEAKETPIEDEEEAYERRRLERQLKEKEASYQRRLREWENREMRKSKEFEKERQKEERRRLEEDNEKRKLKEFLEDYDDDRFDQKYYKGNSLMRRMRDREKEVIADESERQQEKRELEELREKLAQEGHPDPDSEVRKRMLSTDESERDRNNRVVSDRIRALMLEARQKSGSAPIGDDDLSLGSNVTPKEEVKTFGFAGMKLQNTANSIANNNSNTVNNGTDKTATNHTSNGNTPDSMEAIDNSGQTQNSSGVSDLKRKKLSVSEVFNPNEDDDSSKTKKRKLPTFQDDNTDSNLSTPTAKNSIGGSDNKLLTSEEKRRQIKALIEKIPTSKEELFKYEIEWSLVDNTLMERRIRPWINKKIAEYIGEEEQALLDFICNKLQSNSSAQSILDDVAMVLDDEAEVFVVKMWRLLIYEIEAKKIGLGK